jgi:aminoglycoside/choline kinase family phosphotransferase
MWKPLTELFERWCGEAVVLSQELTQAGSNRRYFRLSSATHSAVGCYGANERENRAFVGLAQHFASRQLPTPHVLAVSECGLYYIQQDLGDISLFDFIAAGRESGTFSSHEKNALSRAIAGLAQVQFGGGKELDYAALCYPQAEFDHRTVMWDLNYFKYYFLKPRIESYDEAKLEADFESLCSYFAATKNSCFMYRDFQSRNVMWHDGSPYFIDFQGGRKGHPHYDVASFLFQAKANFSDDLRGELLDAYLANASKYADFSSAEFAHKLPAYALLRVLQTLGAYGFRGSFEHKTHFLQSMPFALANLRLLLLRLPDELNIAYLRALLERLCDLAQPALRELPTLRVEVCSFSYRRGLPEDASGNGGGFVFDCRSIPNPGRLDAFRLLTGADKPVVQFLDASEDMQAFLQHAYALVDVAVERYVERDFRRLQVCFGCTGGQHRSVYSAAHLATHLRSKYPQIEVGLRHRENLKFEI